MFKLGATDIHEYTETVSNYIAFCEGLCIPTKTKTSYPNDNHWFTTDIKHYLHAKLDAYKDNDKDKYKKARYAAEEPIKTSKANCPDKLEENPTINNSKNIWQAITYYIPSPKNTTATDTTLPDKLTDFTPALISRTLFLLPLSQGFTVTNLSPSPSSFISQLPILS